MWRIDGRKAKRASRQTQEEVSAMTPTRHDGSWDREDNTGSRDEKGSNSGHTYFQFIIVH